MPKKKKPEETEKLTPEQIKEIRGADAIKLGRILGTPTKHEVLGLKPARTLRLMRTVALHELLNRPGIVDEQLKMTGGELADRSLAVRRDQIEKWRKRIKTLMDLESKKGQI